MNKEIERLAFSVMEAARAIGVSSRTVRTLVKDGSLPHTKIGTRVLIEVEASSCIMQHLFWMFAKQCGFPLQ